MKVIVFVEIEVLVNFIRPCQFAKRQMIDVALVEISVKIGRDDNSDRISSPSVHTVVEDSLLLADQESFILKPSIDYT